MKNLLFIQHGQFALEINANDKGTAADVVISYRPAYSNNWIEMVKYIVSCAPLCLEPDSRRLAESIIRCSAQATADMLEDLSILGVVIAEKMEELYDKLNAAEG